MWLSCCLSIIFASYFVSCLLRCVIVAFLAIRTQWQYMSLERQSMMLLSMLRFIFVGPFESGGFYIIYPLDIVIQMYFG